MSASIRGLRSIHVESEGHGPFALRREALVRGTDAAFVVRVSSTRAAAYSELDVKADPQDVEGEDR